MIWDFIKISRPRFWLYLAGPFLVGFSAGAETLLNFKNPIFLVMIIYFLLPANFILYGVNDLADEETVLLNEKKEGKELVATGKRRKIVFFTIWVSLFLSIIPVLLLRGVSLWLFALFLILSLAYSLKPIRFKAVPILDFISNILYILPGMIGFVLTAGVLPKVEIIMASMFWVFAMHIFSAVPDIVPDQGVGIKTTAVFLGAKKSLFLSLVFWLSSVVLVYMHGGFGGWIWLGLIYPILALLPIINNKIDLLKIYWYFPYINAVFGFTLFCLAIWDKIHI